MAKYGQIALPIIHAAISAVGNWTTLPVASVAGWENFSMLLALLCAATGTVVGFAVHSRKWRAISSIAALFVVAGAFLGYSLLIAQGGATAFELVLLLLFYILIFSGIFYLLTQFERVVAGFVKP
jgi:hypothetical protein